ncbi:hypothetical protein GUJ93_ZPchr0011g27998 [Zizania palustris]|uniref:RRM domain-containing protein n=1 Tax=Zizania palustris TaxID=103762 RepID=A0A8J5WLE0_ZIZPA|nr:hypothetical protein GUJ93_ZPchr0011g27998 [Zizania palustris]
MEKKKAKKLRKNDDHSPHSEPSASSIKRKRERRKPRDPSPGSGSDSDGSPPSSPTSVRRLLEPYSKPRLLALLADAASADPALLARLRAAADASPSHRRLFVHGLPPHADGPALAEAFSRFGSLAGCDVVARHDTGQCKGYGFVTFHSRAAACRALRAPRVVVAGRDVSAQFASAGPEEQCTLAGAAVVAPPVAAPTLQPVLDAAVASGVVDLAMYAQNPAQAAALLGKNPILAAAVLNSALASTTAALSPNPAAASSLGPAALVARRPAAAPATRPLLLTPPSSDTAAAAPSPEKIVATISGGAGLLGPYKPPSAPVLASSNSSIGGREQ